VPAIFLRRSVDALIHIKAGLFDFEARLEQEAAPKTSKLFLSLVPDKQRIIHMRWNSETCCFPFGSSDFGLFETRQSFLHPARSFSIPAGSAKLNSFWFTAGSPLGTG
jgi:hypothetical protein